MRAIRHQTHPRFNSDDSTLVCTSLYVSRKAHRELIGVKWLTTRKRPLVTVPVYIYHHVLILYYSGRWAFESNGVALHVFFMAIVSLPHFKSRAQCVSPLPNSATPPYFTLDNINKTSFQWCRVQRHIGLWALVWLKLLNAATLWVCICQLCSLTTVFGRRLVSYMFPLLCRTPFLFSFGTSLQMSQKRFSDFNM